MEAKNNPIDIYGTLGPACNSLQTLQEMFHQGMTGIRLNLSHTTLEAAGEMIDTYHKAAENCGVQAKLLVDLQGPELRIGSVEPVELKENDLCTIGHSEGAQIPVNAMIADALTVGREFVIDDGKLLLKIEAEQASHASGCMKTARVLRGGRLTSNKSIAIPGTFLKPPALTPTDLKNIKSASSYGVTGVMQPFVRSLEDLQQVRKALDENNGKHIRIFAKIENLSGVENLESFFPIADEIVIARGDLGNAMPLWKLPRVQKQIEKRCKEAGKPFMVVTQMLASMEAHPVPTRAEVGDIYNAVIDGAASVMVTGETAAGKYPIETIKYLAKTAEEARKAMYTKNTLIFDLDGTLLNTIGDLAASTNYALETYGYKAHSVDEVRSFVGNGIRRLIELAIPGGSSNPDFEKVFAAFKAHYAQHCNDTTDLYPGIQELLQSLKAQHYKLAIVSNKADSAVQKLCRIYFADLIPVAIGEKESQGIRKKPAPDTVFEALRRLGSTVEEAIYIGDSEVDIATAANCGMDAVLCSWGFRSVETLLECGASYIIDYPSQLWQYCS